MDYSASIHGHDGDHPAAASPWGTPSGFSPDHSRTAFADAAAADSLASPDFGYDPGNGLAHDEGGFGPADAGFHRPDTASTTASTPDATAPEPHSAADFDFNQQSPQQQQPPLQQRQDQQQPLPHQSQQPQHHQPYQQPPPGQQQQQIRRPTQPHCRLQAKITGLERTGRKDSILRFDVHTNLPSFRTTQYRDVRRLHSEFVKLAEYLISANPDALVPAVPPALTSAGAGTDEDEARVKATMQRWFNYMCGNETLIRDDEMLLFVESDFGYSPMVRKKQPATGVRRKLLKQFAPPPDDTPELQEARPIVKLFYLGAMDASHKVDKLVKARRGLGLAESDFGVRLGSMHVQEPHQGLANAYRKLGKITQAVGDYHAAQATAEATTLSDPLQYHSQDAFIVKETLTNRNLLRRELLQASDAVRSRTSAADRLRASTNVRREKVDEAIASLDDACRAEAALQEKMARVTANLTHERRRWFARTSADLRGAVREHVLREIEAERRSLALLESVRADIRAIDASGGLSRLGRESHPATRRASLAASQGPKGDAWSGVPRRSAEVVAGGPGGVGGASSILSGSTTLGGARSSVAGSTVLEAADETGGDEAAGRALMASGLLGGDEYDEDRVDARNAASRLATSTF